MIIIIKAMESKSEKLFQHGIRIDFSMQHFQGLSEDSFLTFRDELFEETPLLIKQETLLGRGTPMESNRVRDPKRTALPRSSGFMVMGLVSGLSLANHSDSGSFLVASASFNQDGFQ